MPDPGQAAAQPSAAAAWPRRGFGERKFPKVQGDLGGCKLPREGSGGSAPQVALNKLSPQKKSPPVYRHISKQSVPYIRVSLYSGFPL